MPIAVPAAGRRTRASPPWRVQRLKALLRSWRYSGGSRDLRLDMLRGFAALAMIADHVGSSPVILPITGGSRFLVSAAEVFVLISGVVVGIVYGRTIARDGAAVAAGRLLGRAAKLYVLTIGLTLAFVGSANLFGFWWQADLSDGLALFVLEVLTLQRTAFLVDIPLMYTLLVFLAAPLLLLLARGYTVPVLIVSWAVWATWQFTSLLDAVRIEGNDVFHLPAWQVIFVGGMVIGYHRASIERAVRLLPQKARSIAVATVCLAVAVLYVVQVTNLDGLAGNELLYKLGFDKANVPVGRLIVLAMLSSFAFVLLSVAWKPISRATGWLLLPLGQNALTAYALHLGVVVLAALLYRHLEGGMENGAVALMQVGAVMSVWLVLKLEPVTRGAIWRRLHPTQLAPADERAA